MQKLQFHAVSELMAAGGESRVEAPPVHPKAARQGAVPERAEAELRYFPMPGAVAVADPDEERFFFFTSLDELFLKQDCLWGDRYEVWEASGRYFELERQYPPLRWWDWILPQDRTYLGISATRAPAQPGGEGGEVRLRRYLAGQGCLCDDKTADLPTLIALGLERTSARPG